MVPLSIKIKYFSIFIFVHYSKYIPSSKNITIKKLTNFKSIVLKEYIENNFINKDY